MGNVWWVLLVGTAFGDHARHFLNLCDVDL